MKLFISSYLSPYPLICFHVTLLQHLGALHFCPSRSIPTPATSAYKLRSLHRSHPTFNTHSQCEFHRQNPFLTRLSSSTVPLGSMACIVTYPHRSPPSNITQVGSQSVLTGDRAAGVNSFRTLCLLIFVPVGWFSKTFNLPVAPQPPGSSFRWVSHLLPTYLPTERDCGLVPPRYHQWQDHSVSGSVKDRHMKVPA